MSIDVVSLLLTYYTVHNIDHQLYVFITQFTHKLECRNFQ